MQPLKLPLHQMQSRVASTKPVDLLNWENFNLGLTSAHRRLKHQDKTFYTSFASTLISRCTLENGVDSDNLDQNEESIIILLNNAFIIIYGQFNLLLHNL